MWLMIDHAYMMQLHRIPIVWNLGELPGSWAHPHTVEWCSQLHGDRCPLGQGPPRPHQPRCLFISLLFSILYHILYFKIIICSAAPGFSCSISSVQSPSCVWLLVIPWTAAQQASLSIPESTQTHIHWVGDAIQPSHPLSSPSPPALNLSQHQGLLKWVSSSHQVAKVLEFQLQHQSHQWHSCYSCVLKFTNLFFSAMSHHLLILFPVFFILRCCSFNL